MKKIWFWVRVLLSAALIIFLFISVDFDEITASLTQSSPVYLFIALVSAMLDRIIMTYKWSILLIAKQIRIPLLRLTGTYLISTFLGLFLPTTVGADAIRAYAVSKEGYDSKDIISSIVVERLLGILALFVFVLASIAFSVFVFGQNFFASILNLFWIILILSAVLLLVVLFSMNLARFKRWTPRLGGWNQKLAGHKIVRKLKEVYQSYASYRNERGALVWFVLLSFVENLLPIFNSYFLSLAFGIEVPLLYFFILIPIVLVLVRLPLSFDGIGIQEGAFVYFLTLIGVSPSEALLLGIATHILAIASLLPGGLLYAFSGLSLRLNSERQRREQFGPVHPGPQETLER